MIAGGEPELCCSMARRGAARHAKQEGGVYAHQYALRAVCTCCAYVEV